MKKFIGSVEKWAIDEMCVCGHPQSSHGSEVINAKNGIIRNSGHGNCCNDNCKCIKFIWEDWIFENTDCELVLR